MSAAIVESKQFEPGTTGWTVDDLDDPEIERQWLAGRVDAEGRDDADVRPALFPGLVIPLKNLWG